MSAGFIESLALLALVCAAGALLVGGWLLTRFSTTVVTGVLYVVVGAVWIGIDGSHVVAATFGLAAIWCAQNGRWGRAGLLAGLGTIIDPGGLILLGVLLLIALRSESNWRRYVVSAAVPTLLALGLSALMMRIPAQGWDLQILTIVPLIVCALWGWPDARRDPFVVGIVAWGVLDTLIRVAALRQPFTIVLVAGPALLATGGRHAWRKYFMLALSAAVLGLFIGLRPVVSPASARLNIPLEFNWLPDKPTRIAYGPDLTLIGVAADTNASAGHRVRIRLTWALNPARYPASPLSIHLTFLNRASLPVLSIDDTVPKERWTQAQVVTDYQAIMPKLPPGLLTIYLTVNYQSARLGVEPVARVVVPVGPGAVTQPVIARLGNGSVTSQGAARILAPSIIADGVSGHLKITQHWISSGPLDQDYKIFVHLTDTNGTRALAQYDAEPQQGGYPTSLWQPGDVIVDDGIALDLSAVPAGVYRLVFGMYADNKRLTLTSCDGHTTDILTLAAVTIAPDRSVSVKPEAVECDLPPGGPPHTPPPANSGAPSG